MKKSTIFFMTFCLSMFLGVQSAQASNTLPNPLTTPATTTVPVEVQRMLDRLEEIKAMDKSEMTPQEKKVLRKEVQTTKKHLREVGGGVYIGGGALIVILILLIVLL